MGDPERHHLTNGETSPSNADAMGTALSPSVPGPVSPKDRTTEKSATSSTSQHPHPTPSLTCKNVPASDCEVESPLRLALHAAAALASVATGDGALSADGAASVQAAGVTQPPPTETSNTAGTTSVEKLPPALSSIHSEGNRTKKKRKASTKTNDQTPLPPHPIPIVPLNNTLATSTIHPGVPGLMYMPAVGVLGGLPPVGFPVMPPSVKASEAPPIFRDTPQRSGKWTREEEEYAELLIELFEKGHIDEKNGSTLRSYLSRKLHCAPMRISKKYAGKGIGKMVFLCKNGFRDMGDGIGSPAYQRNMQRLQKAEMSFYKSCFPELAAHIITAPSLHATGTSQARGFLPPLPPLNMIQNVQAPIAPSTGLIQSNGPLPNLLQGPLVLHQPQALAAAGTLKPAMPLYWVPPPNKVAVSTSASSTLSAVDPSGNAPATALAESLAPQPQTQLTASQSLEKAYADVAKAFEQENKVASNGSTRAHIQPRGSVWASKENNDKSSSSAEGVRPLQQPAHEMADFLSGFDRVAGQGNTSSNTKTTDSVQCSPAFTSRSFDELHRLLGQTLTPEVKSQGLQAQNLPPLPSAYTASSRPKEGVVPLPVRCDNAMGFSSVQGSLPFAGGSMHGPGPTPMIMPEQVPGKHQFMLTKAYGEALSMPVGIASRMSAVNEVADAYNLFAQQSAFAASQHSAYTCGQADDGLSLLSGDEMRMGMPLQRQPLLTPAAISNRNALSINQAHLASSDMLNIGLSIRNSAVVSDPSNTSDQGSDETQVDTSGSGTDGTDNHADGSSNDSDEANSESTRKRRRAASHPNTYCGQPIFKGQEQPGEFQFYESLDSHFGGDFGLTSQWENRYSYS